jgi:hypothetical protein
MSSLFPTPTPVIVLPKLSLNAYITEAGTDNTYDGNNVPNILLEALCVYTDNTDETENTGVVDFYLYYDDTSSNNRKHIGSAEFDNLGKAVINIYQEPGTYKVQAVWTANQFRSDISSDIIKYEVKKPLVPSQTESSKPVLKLY